MKMYFVRGTCLLVCVFAIVGCTLGKKKSLLDNRKSSLLNTTWEYSKDSDNKRKPQEIIEMITMRLDFGESNVRIKFNYLFAHWAGRYEIDKAFTGSYNISGDKLIVSFTNEKNKMEVSGIIVGNSLTFENFLESFFEIFLGDDDHIESEFSDFGKELEFNKTM